MSDPDSEAPRRGRRHLPSADILQVVLVYATFASLWILLSDKALEWLVQDAAKTALIGTLKGWVFVAVTSLLLYGLMRGTASTATPDPERSIEPMARLRHRLPFALVAAAILALTVGALLDSLHRNRATGAARLEAIADLRTRQIADWLKERDADAELIRTGPGINELYRQWAQDGDPASGERLKARLDLIARTGAFCAVALLDPQGRPLWASPTAPPDLPQELRAAVREARRAGQVRRVGPYLDAQGQAQLAYVAPLDRPDPPPVLVLYLDPGVWLFPTLRTWPVPSKTGESLLVRREGDRTLYLNDLRHRRDAALRLRLPIGEADVLAPQLLRPDEGQRALLTGVDYRGVPVLGVAMPVPGTDWTLLAKADRSELFAQSVVEAGWIALVGLLALFTVAAGLFLMRQRERLALAETRQQAQSEREKGLRLQRERLLSDRQRAEAELQRLNARLLRRQRALQEAVEELDAFAYSVSHDLRSPLRGIEGYSKMLLEDYGERLDDEGRLMLGGLRESAAQMARMIEDLLAFSRMGRRPVRAEPVDMGELVQGLVREMEMGHPGRRLRWEIAELPPCLGDTGMLGEVLRNLLDNAVKFSAPREEAVIEIGFRPAESGTRVYYVRDNGVGFDPRYGDKLFRVFQRLHRVEDFEGTGVGLALIQRIVQKHGGRVWAESAPDLGATFFVELPCAG